MNSVMPEQPLIARRGAIHIHTAYSDGSGSMDEIIDAALEAGLDYLVISDHDQPYAAADGWSGWQRNGKILVEIATELRSAEKQDLLVFDANLKIASHRHNSPELLRLLKNLGVKAFLAHPQGNRQFWTGTYLRQWTDWDIDTYSGMEIWCYMHDWIQDFNFFKASAMCRNPEKYINGPDRNVLKNWDLQARKRKVAGLGAIDVHARKVPRPAAPFFPAMSGGVLPYLHTFRAFSHWALVPDTKEKNNTQDLMNLRAALSEGRGWVCREEIGCGREFRFELDDSGQILSAGNERTFSPEQLLKVNAPKATKIRLLNRGEVVAEKDAESMEFSPDAPGEYRVEAFIDEDIWILSNHIYLRDSKTVQHK